MIDAARAHKVKILGLDVDGVLTDNAVFLGNVDGNRVEFKRFDIQDGLGIGIARTAGIPVFWLSGRHSEATTLRGEELRIEEILQVPGAAKLGPMEDLLVRRNLEWENIAFIGDDLADLPLMRRVGLPIAVANAVDEIKECSAYVTRRAGGFGAVREAIEVILKARGEWSACIDRFMRQRGDAGD